MCQTSSVYGSNSKACSGLNTDTGMIKFGVFEQRLIRPSPVEASGLEILRAGAIRDICAIWRDGMTHSIGNWVIPGTCGSTM